MATITGSAGNDTLNGTAAADLLQGLAGDDTLNGLGADDTLDGGTGADTMAGGAGNDLYIVDDTGERVTELAGEGTDRINASVSFSLASLAQVENLLLLGTADLNATGNAGNNVLVGNAGNNVLNGGAGTDTASYAAATSAVTVRLAVAGPQNTSGAGQDTLVGIENLLGSAFADRLDGNAVGNVLNGGAGADTLAGGAGNDTYVVDSLADVVTEAAGAGTDTVQAPIGYSLAALANLENLTLTGTAAVDGTGNDASNALTGNAGANTLLGGNGNDTLIGGGGADTLDGGAGSDVLVFNPAASAYLGGLGIDTLRVDRAGVTLGLSAGSGGLERLNLTGAGNNSFVADPARLEAVATGGTLRVIGNAGDAVLSSAFWAPQGVFADGLGFFARYTSGAATLEVDTDVASGTLRLDIPLATLNGTDGFRLPGAAANTFTGDAVSAAGDVNGDGFADLLVGASRADASGADSGAAYLVFGRAGGFGPDLGLGGLDGSNGLRLAGAAADDLTGVSVSGAGDVNGDGFADLIVGASRADASGSNSGAAYVVFGTAVGLGAGLDLGVLNGSNGLRLSGAAASSYAGASVSGAGDVNGDGFDDLIVGATFDPAGTGPGAAYVVFGRAGGFAAEVSLGGLDGSNGFRLAGVATVELAGRSVSAAGDVNGDGLGDLLVGAAAAAPNGSFSGAAYVVFGQPGGFAASLDLASLNGSNGFRLSGASAYDAAGFSVSQAGDVNGDGFVDVIVGAYGADPSGPVSGAAYVVFGRAGGFASDLNLGTLNGANGFRLSGGAANARAGVSVSGAGDVNGDGFDDLLVGASGAAAGGPLSGALYLVFGRAGGFAANLSLASLTAADGLRVSGVAAYDGAGGSVSRAGDVNGDGFDDLILSARFADVSGADSGAAYTLFGRDFTGRVGFPGGAANDTLTGTTAAEVLIGGLGNDTIQGGAGADVLRGGAGNDLLLFDAADRRIDGGSGRDTLQVAGAGNLLDLTAIADTRITGVEAIDLSGTGDNTLVLGMLDLTHLSESSNVLRVSGDPGDAVAAGGGWIYRGDVRDGGQVYAVYAQGPARLQVDADIERTGIGFSIGLGSNGSRLPGAAAGDSAGGSVSQAGDVNGDGFGDLIVGAYEADPNGATSGAVYVVLGRAGGLPADLRLGTLNGTNGFRLAGAAAGDRAGVSVAHAGDVNGDGFGDLIVGADDADANGATSGAAYVVFGRAGGFAADLNLGSLNGTNGLRLAGAAAGDRAGVSVAHAGDVNGDGFDDLIVGAYGADANGAGSGAAHVVFGRAGGFTASLDLASLNGSDGFRLSGAAALDYAGGSVSGAGDVNGDGFDDLIVGAFGADANGSDSGAAYVVLGRAGGFAGDLNLGTLDGRNGFRLSGAAADDYAGGSVSGAGDVNGDGFDDLIVGAERADPNGATSGAAYVVFGRAGGFAADLNLGSLNGSNGFRLSGAVALDYAGGSVSRAGDVNGDGFDDLIVGAFGADPGGDFSGAAYTVLGRDFNGAAVQLEGGAGNDVLNGTAAAEGFVGGLGDDTFVLGGAADSARGGAGNDVFVAADLAFRRLDGGSGQDTLRLTGAGQLLDLAGLPNGRLTGLELIDLSGSGDNTLFLSAADLLDLSDSTDVLRVQGDAGDQLLTRAESWVPGAVVSEGAFEYQSYTLGQATLLVETSVTQFLI